MSTPLNLADVYTPQYTAEVEDFRHYIGVVLRQIFLRVYVQTGLAAQKSREELFDQSHHPTPTALHFTRRLITHLEDLGLLSTGPDGKLLVSPQLVDEDPDDSQMAAYLNRHPENRKMYQFLGHVRDVMDQVVLKGEDAMLTLVDNDFYKAMKLWEDLMENAVVKVPCQHVAARALKRLLAGSPHPVRVFEGGAGVGAALRFAFRDPEIRALAPTKLDHYWFTDISLSLIKMGRGWIQEHGPEGVYEKMTFKVVNLDKLDLPDAFAQESSLDAILCENVLHDVTDLKYTLERFHHMLKPGGQLIVSMAFRQPPKEFFMFEFMQSSFHSYFAAKLEPGFREQYGWMGLAEWQNSLKRAGFPEIEIYPDPAHHPQWPFGGLVAHCKK